MTYDAKKKAEYYQANKERINKRDRDHYRANSDRKLKANRQRYNSRIKERARLIILLKEASADPGITLRLHKRITAYLNKIG